MGAGGPVAEISGPGGLRRDQPQAGGSQRPARPVHAAGAGGDQRAPVGGGDRSRHGLWPGEAPLQHLSEDVPPGEDDGGAVRPVRLPGAGGHGAGLLQRTGGDPRHLQAHSGPVQGLYRHTQAQYVPVSAHHRHRRGGHPLRGADPHL